MSNHIKNVVVFCGSSPGNDQGIIDESEKLGRLLGENGYDFIYGGGTSGLMGVSAKAALAAGSFVKGVIPKIFHTAGSKEQGHLQGALEQVVDSMSERKEIMMDEADACIVLPGAYGSLDEIYEMAVAQQLKVYTDPEANVQPIIVLNFEGFYDGQIASLDKMVEKGFLSADMREFVQFVDTADEAIAVLNASNAIAPVQAKQYLPKPK